MTLVPDALHPLPLPPLPAILERAFGYPRDARFVLFYSGDEFLWYDGQVSTAGEWSSFLRFLRHPKVIWALEDYFFGASDAPARDGLVLDRATRALYAGSLLDGERFVREQYGPELSFAEWAQRAGIPLEEGAEERWHQAVETWLAAFQAQHAALPTDPQAFQSDVAERMRIAAANESLLQAALDALPEVELPAPPPGMSVHRTLCGLCQSQIATVPQAVGTLPEVVKNHLLGMHHLTRAQWSSATWQSQPDGCKRWMQEDQVLIVVEPPHIWIQIEDKADNSLESGIAHAMINLCRQQHHGLFDELALGIWCGIGKKALLQRARQITGTSESLTISMVEYTLDALERSYRRWQEWHVAEQS